MAADIGHHRAFFFAFAHRALMAFVAIVTRWAFVSAFARAWPPIRANADAAAFSCAGVTFAGLAMIPASKYTST
jgi:hypothetical protein